MITIKYKYECHKIITWITGREEKGLVANDRSHDPRPTVCLVSFIPHKCFERPRH